MKSQRVFFFIALALTVCSASAAQAQAPAWSRGQQNLGISYDECLRRIPLALQGEGYRIDNVSGDFAVGIKNVHTAVIICSPAPDAKMFVHVVVASNGEGGGTERQRLQALMEGSAPSTTSGGNTGNGEMSGTWTYYDSSSGFTSVQVFDRNGTIRSPSESSNTGRWAIEGNELVSRWSNGWVNRLAWPAVGGRLTGIAIGPGGERHNITLTRSGGPGGNAPATGNTGGGIAGGGAIGGDVFGPRESNTSYNGANLTYFARPTVEQCQLDCANNPNCKGYTFIQAGTFNRGDAAMCYLLSAITGRNADPGHISALKGGGGHPGGDISVAGIWTWAYAPTGQQPVVHGTVTVSADGSLNSSTGDSGSWRRSGNSITLTWTNGSVDTLNLSSDARVMSGTNNAGWNVRGTKQ